MYKRVVGAGFSPRSFHDVKSRELDVVMIEVGEDLGAPALIDSYSLSVVIDAKRNFRQIIETF